MRKKPADCSKALGPRRLTSFNCFRLLNRPFSLRYSTMFWAVVFVNPEMCCNKAALAVFKFTPTWFTAVSTTKSNRSRSEEHTSELQSRFDLVCRLLLEKKKDIIHISQII